VSSEAGGATSLPLPLGWGYGVTEGGVDGVAVDPAFAAGVDDASCQAGIDGLLAS
jgi:hypothetical protein